MATDWLHKLRMEKFPSQTALALAAGIKPARYSRIEKGYCDMREEEIEGLAKALTLTVDEVRSGQPGVAKPGAVKAKSPKGMRAASVVEAPLTKQPTVLPPSSPSPAVPTTETKPGDKLDDPKNFSLMPPTELLSHRDSSGADVRSQLQKAAIFAEKVLHTSRVRPAVWVAWRDFGRDAQKFLRGPTPTVAPVELKPIEKPQNHVPKPLPVRTEIVKTPAPKTLSRSHGNKNVFGHFVDVAREWLPAATSAALNEKSLAAKTSNPELGFMKHFKRIAEIELPRAEFDRIDREASRRDSPNV